MKQYAKILFTSLAIIIALTFCGAVALVTTGSGLTMLYFREPDGPPTAAPVTTLRPLALVRGTETPATATVAALLSIDTATPTPSPLPETPTPTEPAVEEATAEALPLTDTPLPTAEPPTDTPQPAQPPPPTDIPIPTDTPAPSYDFAVIENDDFPTGKPDFDVFIAVTNEDNKPLGGYRVISNHSSGMQVESATSAAEWTENSGAKHYKAGNIKIHIPTSPGGAWTLQLIDESNQPVAAPLELPFDDFNPSWYFVLFRETD